MKKIIIIFLIIIIGFYNLYYIYNYNNKQQVINSNQYYKITLKTNLQGKPIHINSKLKKHKNIKLIADNNTFSYWIIKGKYKIIKGNLKSPILTIQPNSNIEANGIFKRIKLNSSLKSPATGFIEVI